MWTGVGAPARAQSPNTASIVVRVVDQTGAVWTRHTSPVNVDGSWAGTLMAPLDFGPAGSMN